MLSDFVSGSCRLGVLYLGSNPIQRVDTGPAAAPDDLTSSPVSVMLQSPTCAAISEELQMRAEAKMLASLAHRWNSTRKYSELSPMMEGFTFVSPPALSLPEPMLPYVSPTDGVEALVNCVQLNSALTTLSIQSTGLEPHYSVRLREAWGKRNPRRLLM